MLKCLCDENFNRSIVNGLLRRDSHLDIVRAQDVGLAAASDSVVLEWIMREQRVLLTHDFRTLIRLAHQYFESGHTIPGVFAVRWTAPIGQVIDDLWIAIECSAEHEWDNQVIYIPL